VDAALHAARQHTIFSRNWDSIDFIDAQPKLTCGVAAHEPLNVEFVSFFYSLILLTDFDAQRQTTMRHSSI
jgi:hypothetical protein